MNAQTTRRCRALTHAAILTLLPLLGGCAATMKTIRHNELALDTEVSQPVFLEPGSHPRTIYIEIGNTSGVDAPIQDQVVSMLGRGGYTVVGTPEEATYLLQATISELNRRLLDGGETVQDAMLDGAVGGLVAGAAVGSLANAESIVDEVMLVAGVAAFILNARTTRPAFTMRTHVRITERLDGADGPRRNVHDVRIVSGASRVNLKLEEALPGLLDGVTRAIVGFFPAGATPAVRVAG